MAITKNLIDMMNGKIDVESEKGKGSTFYVTLTFEIAKKKDTAAADASKSAEGEANTLDFTKVHVLVAEDMDINAQILIRLLGQKGIKADRAENGQVALDMFTASEVGTYDAIFMDMRMPVMNGLESATAIRALDRADAKTVPIIALTANAFDEDVERSLQSGLNAHLSKPLEPDMIFKTLKRLVH
jgi:CheY-like chemotaxis protein